MVGFKKVTFHVMCMMNVKMVNNCSLRIWLSRDFSIAPSACAVMKRDEVTLCAM